jgi:hypothetical protein
MSVTRHHAEWLSLIEVSGPFLSMPVLMRVFPQGLDPREPQKARELRLAYEEWLEKPLAPGRHQAWVRFVLTRFLEFPENLVLERQSVPYGIEAHMAEYGEMLRPDYAVAAPPGHVAARTPHLLLQVYPPGQNLDGPVAGKHWKASPATRMTELLHAVDIPQGMITNGEQWMLVYAPRGDASGYASWYAGIWQEEPITLRAFSSVMHTRRFFGVAEGDTITALLKESAHDQQEVTDQLGLQVRRAVEVLVQALDRLDQESGRQLLRDIEPKELYDAALTIMMRLVFLFSAEERGMLRLGEPLYDENYAASTLREQLREAADQHGEEVLERRSDAWSRLLATFRAVYGGIAHETLRLPAYRGTLFDPDRYPFLEGRQAGTDWRRSPSAPPNINNRVVLHLLESLQLLQMKVPGGGPAEARRLSFRALDIEQIGHVYEGLLDHTAVRAATTILGLQGTKNSEPEIPLEKLEQLRAEGEEPLIEYLKEETKRSEPAIRRALAETDESKDHKLAIACGQDVRQHDHIRPLAGLLRMDSFDMPVVVFPGSVYVTESTTRRSTGTHYTPKTLTEPIVQHTLEPLVYDGPAKGRPKDQWKLKSPREILALRMCDMTMGSGAFLVQSCRYLAERLAEAWENTEQASPGSFVVTPEGELSMGDPAERLLPKDPDERLVIARRAVADRCLYGVDINPMAVEMAKLSLWLVTMQKDRPFTFLDHALKCGDSLLGVISLEQIENFSLRPDVKQITFATANLFRYVEEAAYKRRQLEALPSESARIAEKIRLHAEAEAATAKVKAIADVIIALELQGLKGKAYENARSGEAEQVQGLIRQDADGISKNPAKNGKPASSLAVYAKEQLEGRRTFHWPLEYPEIFERGGFDAFVGNPPFMGGQKITGNLGTDYRDLLVTILAQGKKGSADLCSYFFLQAHALLKPGGTSGLLATNTIAQGDTREVGLEQISERGGCIYRAVSSRPWPGDASLEVAHVWQHAGEWQGDYHLDDQTVPRVSPFLTIPGKIVGKPFRLAANADKSFQGSIVLGMGFVLTPEEARELIAGNPNNADCLFPYLNGEDLNSRPDQSPSRWVINFHDWPLNRTAEGFWLTADKEERKAWLREGIVPRDYSEPVVADYPDLLAIIEEKVKPERQKLKDDDGTQSRRKRFWWQYGSAASTLYSTIAGMERYLIHPLTSKHHNLVFYRTGIIASQMTVVLAIDSWGDYCLLQTDLHWKWALEYGNKLENRPQYTSSDCFETYPFPESVSGLESIGERYYTYRQSVIRIRRAGLTQTYNLFHNPTEASEDIVHLRALHVEMDQAVATAYGLNDIDLGHGFHETKQGIRFTISESVRRIVLDRLLSLNHERYEAEVKAGLHGKKGAWSDGKGRKTKSSPEKKKDQYEIFEE